MAKLNITIGYTDPRPDQTFINLVRNICSNRPLANDPPEIQIVQLAKHNIRTFINAVENVRETIHAGHSAPSFPEDYFFNLIVFDIKKLHKAYDIIPLLIKELKGIDCALLLLNVNTNEFNSIVLKYDGTDTTYNSILSFAKLFPNKAKNVKSSTLISPFAFKRSKVAAEKMFVKKVSTYYGDLGFIKLPLDSVNDFCNYALKNQADLLVLSKGDLYELAQLFSNGSFRHFNGLSVFISTGSLSNFRIDAG
ncbi:hypothetical protein C900_01484 [Fulvivirga imtechensis AK7]|uniref:Uncharacterized protein n=1 Tax=Fulvivirga imtechensis AK7 TaxID=1237149 RepID=L8JXX2_9BACT|nr:hypothetical protein [Fulvivirga imtechensis]ELR72489.1 hypothetical protein C900_01484 [Fulvivirga imtechensis AK7]